jgi:WD40 repeat protein
MAAIEIIKHAELTGHEAAIFALTEGRTPQYVLSGAGEGWVVEWDLENAALGKLIAKAAANIYALVFDKASNKAIAGDMNGGIHFLNLNDSTLSKHIKHHEKGCFGLKIRENNLFSLGGDGVFTRWNLSEMRSVESLQLSGESLRCLVFSPRQNIWAIGSSDGNIYIVEAYEFTILHVFKSAHRSSVFSLAFSPDEKYLISGGRDAFLKMWQMSDYQLITSVPAHNYTINALVFNPENERIFASASRDKTIKIWEFMPELEAIRLMKVIDSGRFDGHTRSVNSLAWLSGKHLVSASDDRRLMVWEVKM